MAAFKLLIDQPMLQTIRRHTENHGKLDDPSFTISINELGSFIGLQLARGVLVAKNTSISDLWNKNVGTAYIFKNYVT